MRKLTLAIAVTAALGVAVAAGGDLGAQEQTERKAPKKAVKRPPPPPKSSSKVGGYPPCTGVLWVDSLCQLPDGRICFVDVHELINCMR